MNIALLSLLIGGLTLLLLRGQQRMIYHPRPYGATEPSPPAGLLTVEYATSQGRQTAFYLPPRTGTVAENLWLMLGGNGSLAIDWLDFLRDFPDAHSGFLLLDYPRYGYCHGKPSPKTILESAEAALSTLATKLGEDPVEIRNRLQVMGHSLGTAAALLYAGRHPVKRLVLISPFTSLKDMAALIVGPLLSQTLLHDYDNRARLREVLAREPAVPVTIIHGNHDKVVPVAMGRELSGSSSKIDYLEIERGDHNYLLVTAAEEIRRVMLGSKPIGKQLT